MGSKWFAATAAGFAAIFAVAIAAVDAIARVDGLSTAVDELPSFLVQRHSAIGLTAEAQAADVDVVAAAAAMKAVAAAAV